MVSNLGYVAPVAPGRTIVDSVHPLAEARARPRRVGTMASLLLIGEERAWEANRAGRVPVGYPARRLRAPAGQRASAPGAPAPPRRRRGPPPRPPNEPPRRRRLR